MNKIMKSLSLLLALLLAMTLSFSVLAEDETADESAVSTEESAETSTEESAEASAEESKSETNTNTSTGTTTEEEVSTFPWARVITLIVIVVLVIVVWVLTKTNTALGQKLKKFFKEYWSEIKKVSWTSPKDTLKATGVVLVFILGAALAIGLLDWCFTSLINGLAKIFN